MTRQIALLRGINLAKRRRVAMGELRELVAGLGYEDVRTHLQSGNVVLSSALTPRRLEAELEREIEAGLGVETRVVVRTRDELAAVVDLNPLGTVADNPSRYLVTFLSGKPSAAGVRELESADVAPEQVVVLGREVYAWHPAGLQRSKLARLVSDDRLGVVGTARNWNTVTRLLELADG